MKICRYNDNKIGLVEGDDVLDVTEALKALPQHTWPFPMGDDFIRHLPTLKPEFEKLAKTAKRTPLKSVTLQSPVANPNKIIAAPVNYQLHIDESRKDAGINFGTDVKAIDRYALFLKSTSSLIGAGEPVRIQHFDGRRTDHEVELAFVIGKQCKDVSEADALNYIAGYAIGLDITIRGPEDRSYRKSFDTFSVLGPYLVTPDEIADPNKLDFSIHVGEELRQKSNTGLLIWNVQKLISVASKTYTLYPGDIIMSGTPEGVAPIEQGNTMHAEIQGIGKMDVKVV